MTNSEMLVGADRPVGELPVAQENIPAQHLLTEVIDRVTHITRNLDASKVPKRAEGQPASAYTALLLEYYNAERRRIIHGLTSSTPSVNTQDVQNEQISIVKPDVSEEHPDVSNPLEHVDRDAMGDQVLEDLDHLGLQMASNDLLDEDEQDDKLKPVVDQLPIKDKKLTDSQKSWLKFGVAAVSAFFGSAALNQDPWMVSTVSYLGLAGSFLVKSVHATLAAMQVDRERGRYDGHKLSKRLAKVVSHRALLSMVGRIDKVTSSSPVLGGLFGAFTYGMLGQGVDLHNRIHHPQQVFADEPKHDALLRPTVDQPVQNNEPFQWKHDQLPPRQGPPASPLDQSMQQPEVGQSFNISTTVWGNEREYVDQMVQGYAITPGHEDVLTNFLKNCAWGLSEGKDIGSLSTNESVMLLNRFDALQAAQRLNTILNTGLQPERIDQLLYSIAQGHYPTALEVKEIADFFPIH